MSGTAPTTTRDASRHVRLHAELAPAIDGDVLRPGAPAYDAALPGFNLALAHRPALVVRATSVADVVATVRGAAAHGVGVGVRSTGHGAPPTGPDELLLDVSALDRLEVEPGRRTATVGPGVPWAAVLEAGAPYGLGGLCGSSPHVGVVGYTLGGGLGPLARTFGLAADHVRSFDVVTAAGELVTATTEEHPDLFWALRGGGGAFGVVVAMTFDLFPLSTVRAGTLWFDVDDAPAVVHRWRERTSTLGDDVSTSVARLNLPPLPDVPEPLRGRAVLVVRYVRHGSLAASDPLVDDLRRVATPLLDAVGDLPYAQIGAVHADPDDPMPFVERGGLLHELTEDAVDAFLGAVPPDSPVLAAEIRLLGGAVARTPAVPNATGGRDAACTLFTGALGSPVGPPDVAEHLQAVHDALAPWTTRGSLLNFAGPRDDVSAALVREAYGPATYDRLVALRRALDPTGVLDPSSRWTVTADVAP